MHQLIRLAAYLWPLPYTLFGFACGLLLAGRFQYLDGVFEIHSPAIASVLKLQMQLRSATRFWRGTTKFYELRDSMNAFMCVNMSVGA